MKKFFAILLLVLSMTANSNRGATVLVDMLSAPNSFLPADIVIDVGDTVVWTNRTFTFHDTVSVDGVWKSSLFGFRGSYRFTFNVAPGVYSYYCTPHRPGMVGTVTVRGAANNPPTVSILSPADNSNFRPTDTIAVNVSANDDSAVSKVDLLVNNNVVQTDNSAPYQFNLTLPAGQHTIAARATDDRNASTTSTPITVNVSAANLPPTVAITSPANNSIFTEPADITITADATDDVAVDHVEFLINGISAGSDATPPYSISQTFTNGMYMVTARAFDNEGAQTTSAEVMFTVNEAIPDAPRVSILFPLNDTYFPVLSNISLIARVSDPDGIATIQFVEGNQILEGTPPFASSSTNFILNVAFAEGVHTIAAQATDTLGFSSTSAPVTFTVQMAATNTYRATLTNGAVRLGFFGSSGLPYVFDYSTNMETWVSFRTNEFLRRILFFDDLGAIDQPMRFYRARSPGPTVFIFPNPSGTNSTPPPPIPMLSVLDAVCGLAPVKKP